MESVMNKWLLVIGLMLLVQGSVVAAESAPERYFQKVARMSAEIIKIIESTMDMKLAESKAEAAVILSLLAEKSWGADSALIHTQLRDEMLSAKLELEGLSEKALEVELRVLTANDSLKGLPVASLSVLSCYKDALSALADMKVLSKDSSAAFLRFCKVGRLLGEQVFGAPANKNISQKLQLAGQDAVAGVEIALDFRNLLFSKFNQALVTFKSERSISARIALQLAQIALLEAESDLAKALKTSVEAFIAVEKEKRVSRSPQPAAAAAGVAAPATSLWDSVCAGAASAYTYLPRLPSLPSLPSIWPAPPHKPGVTFVAPPSADGDKK